MSGDFWVNGPRQPPPGKGVYVVHRLSWKLGTDGAGGPSDNFLSEAKTCHPHPAR